MVLLGMVNIILHAPDRVSFAWKLLKFSRANEQTEISLDILALDPVEQFCGLFSNWTLTEEKLCFAPQVMCKHTATATIGLFQY